MSLFERVVAEGKDNLPADNRNVLSALIDYQRSAAKAFGIPIETAEGTYYVRVINQLLKKGFLERRSIGPPEDMDIRYRVTPKGYKAAGRKMPPWMLSLIKKGFLVDESLDRIEPVGGRRGHRITQEGLDYLTAHGWKKPSPPYTLVPAHLQASLKKSET